MVPLVVTLSVLAFSSVASANSIDNGESFPFSQLFSTSVRPCVDLNEFVCNGDENAAHDLFETQKKESMKELIDDFFLQSNDSILRQFREVIEAQKAEDDHFKLGEGYGRKAALGRAKIPEIKFTDESQTIQLKFGGLGDNDRASECEYSTCPPLFRGIVRGFFETLYVQIPIWLAGLTVVYKRFEDHNPMFHVKTSAASLQAEFISRIKDSQAPYFYMLWAQEMLEGEKFPLELIDVLSEIFENVREEAVAVIEECAWLEARDKQKIVTYLESGFETVLGFPHVFYNTEKLSSAIEFTQDQFAINAKKLQLDQQGATCEGACRFKLYTEALLLADKLHRSLNGDFDDGLDRENRKSSLLAYNAYNTFTHTVILPAYIHIYKDPFPLGFIYGTIGATFAHEIAHSLGIRRKPFREHFTHHKSEEFRNATQCYDNYYSSFTLTKDDGNVVAPNGAAKSEEGFADVEGSRIAFRALSNVVQSDGPSKRYAARRVRFDKFNDFEWFFIGIASKFCVSSSNYDLEREVAQLKGSHPRETIRANAIVGQMSEFAETFQCNEDDPMQTVDDVCFLYE